MSDSGLYLLALDVPATCVVRVGALGEQRIVAGRYGYVGSARRGLSARLRRHFRRDKPQRWHLDYLRPVAEPLGALTWPWRAGLECRLAAAVTQAGLGRLVLPRFGASDCSCPGHLLLLAHAELGIIAEELGRAVGQAPEVWSEGGVGRTAPRRRCLSLTG